MKKKLFLAASVLFGTTVFAQVGINTTTPNAQLDIRATSATAPSNTDGLLIPKVNIFPATNPTAAQQGMLLYLTTTSGSNAPGFYYWDNPTATWIGLGKDVKAWQLSGNTVNAATDFMGSTNDADVIFKRNNVRAGRIGIENTSFGVYALNPASTGTLNTASGASSLHSNTTGYENTASGSYSLRYNTEGNNNTASGAYSLHSNTTGSQNTAIGYYAFFSGDSFSNSTALGYNTVISASNQVRLGNNAVTSIGGQVSWTTLSDARFKTENAAKVPGIDFIKKLRPVTYYVNHEAMNRYLEVPKGEDVQNRSSLEAKNTYKPNYTKTLESGFMAQEVEKAAKELGYEFNGVDAPKNEKDYYGLRYGQFVVPLVKAVQELNEKLEQKDAENAQLRAKLLELEERIAKLEKNASN